MAFDDKTRRTLLKTVTACRNLLTEDFDEQLRSRFGIYADEGRVLELERLAALTDAERDIARVLRDRIAHLSAGRDREGIHEAVKRILREQAFTILNRFAALRMAEERGIIRQSVGAGLQSKGFRVFEDAAGGEQAAALALGQQHDRYLVYLECLFDELSLDLGILFDRSDAMGLLIPTQGALRKLFEELNSPAIAPLWLEDETIGWIYQYYNDEAERKKMREQSSAPRNSRELAVRNQFFTPRYVVEFLTDNTLGRLWYEMTKGQTHLNEQCRYLVRRPTEVFLKPGESVAENVPDKEASTAASISQEELLRQSDHIPHRPLKDPREIRLLDPACGSMHFGLYAFDLFEVIYSEAWDIANAGTIPPGADPSFSDFLILASSFPTKEEFLREVPRLIIENNLHGIDIDPRAAQIAGLSLWLRAQRAWHQASVKPADRPRVTRSNIVCAEPMPGEKEMLREFVEQQFPAGERPAFAFLLEKIFDRMTLAGEAGSLLRMEEEIRTSIADTKRLWKQGPRHEHASLFAEPGERASQGEMVLDLSGITDEQFWERAEQRIYDALEAYAGQAVHDGGFQRRLFADDAAQGFAFIDLCRKRYDVAVMNPPFGQFPVGIEQVMRRMWHSHANDIYVPFVLWASSRLEQNGRIGAITSRNFLIGRDQREFRPLVLGKGAASLELFVDLGLRVLDGAEVDTATYVLSGRSASAVSECGYWDFRKESREDLHGLASLLSSNSPIFRRHTEFWDTPANLIAFAASTDELADLSSERRLDPHVGRVTKGLSSSDDFRFLKLMWEPQPADLGSRWIYCAKGADYSWVISNINTVVDWHRDGELLAAYAAVVGDNIAQARRSSAYYLRSGLTHTYRCDDFSLRALPAGCIFTNGSPVILPADATLSPDLLALFLSRRFEKLLSFVSKKGLYETGRVGLLPAPPRRYGAEKTEEWRSLVRFLMTHERRLEYTAYFVVPCGVDDSPFDPNGCRQLLEEFASLSQEEVSTGFIDRGTKGYADRYATCARSLDDWVSYSVGSAFGRWDIRYATGERQAPELPDPFAPLPVCPPGMLQGDDGLPLSPEAGRRLRAEGRYPLDVAWDGILVDDPEHPLDLLSELRQSLHVLWSDRAEATEAEACEILGVKAKPKENLDALRVYFRDPNRFFKDHLSRYSKSRRKAPIYWPLSTASGSYTLWIYYPRLTSQTLYTCVSEFIDPKRENIGRDLETLRSRIGAGGTAEERQKVEELSTFHAELKTLRDHLLSIANLPYRPNLNDGVQITAAPLWQCFLHAPWQKVLMDTWKELEKGDYDWAHLTLPIWPDRVKKKCKTDRSLAIAHGLEELCEVKAPEPKTNRAVKKVGKKGSTAEGLL